MIHWQACHRWYRRSHDWRKTRPPPGWTLQFSCGFHLSSNLHPLCNYVCKKPDENSKINFYMQNALFGLFSYIVLWVFMWGRSSTPNSLYRWFILEQFLFTLSISTSKQGVCRSLICVGGVSIAVPLLMHIKIKNNQALYMLVTKYHNACNYMKVYLPVFSGLWNWFPNSSVAFQYYLYFN